MEKIPSRIICKGAPNKSPEAIDALLMHSYDVCFTRFSKPFPPKVAKFHEFFAMISAERLASKNSIEFAEIFRVFAHN